MSSLYCLFVTNELEELQQSSTKTLLIQKLDLQVQVRLAVLTLAEAVPGCRDGSVLLIDMGAEALAMELTT